MALLKVQPSKVLGEIVAPPSKSYTHRAFMIALLADGESRIRAPLLGLDTLATIDAARILGAEVSQDGEVWRVCGTGGKIKPKKDVIDVKNSGTTIRMISAISALSHKPVKLTGDESIQKRPMGPLVESLKKLGAKGRCEGPDGRPPVVVGGGLAGGEVEITGAVSSQFISALLLAAPYAREDTKITITEELRSKPYIEITLELMEAADAKVKRNKSLTEFSIPGGQVFKPLDLAIPGDFSSAAFVLGAAAITASSASVKNLNVKSAQGDKRIVDFLGQFGADVFVKGKTVHVSSTGELSGIEADCGDNPDLVPVLAVLGSVADGKTRLSNIPHLRVKETDRLRALAVGLRKFRADAKEQPDGLQINGVKELSGAKVESFGDHRMAMAFAVAGLVARGQTVVDGAESIPVSYPTFVGDMVKLGAKIELIE
ncbi:MAG: 3-phosphoshikimate 1-carboxyvinyltransferase [Candidatus Hadarchaeota archaeon]